MADEQIRIEKIKVKDLYKFACRIYDLTKENEIVPIDKHRALAYTNNPYADENDIGLLVAYKGDQCLGYLGIMPGLLKIGDQFSKIHWLSTWFVPPEYRKTSVGLSLILTAFSLKYDLVVCGMSEEAEKVYRGLRFCELGPLNYYVMNLENLNFLQLAFRLLRKLFRIAGIKFEIPDAINRLSTYLHTPIKKVIYRTLLRDQKSHLDEIRVEEVDEIHQDTKQTKNNAVSTQFYRGNEIINWMLRYKWTKEREKAEICDFNYYFSEIRDVFQFITLKVFSAYSQDYKGFLVLSFSAKNFNSVLKILDFHFCNDKDYKYVALLALKYANMHQADSIELPESLLIYIKGNHPILRLLFRREKRIYLCYPNNNNPLTTSLGDIDPNYCDGDTPFT